MDSIKSEYIRYKIEMKICKPKKMTERGGWFSHDSSSIDFAALKPKDIECGEYFDKGTSELISGPDEKPAFNQFEFSGQVFAWEEIFVFRISNQSSRGWNPDMFIVMPMKYKSFVTTIDLTDINFQSDKIIFLSGTNAVYDESKLMIRQSLRNLKGVEVDTFALKEILGGK
jgi:hypothetical protein